ncbi:MAG: hypothetical protein R2757_00680 [Draconibacterium sp.]
MYCKTDAELLKYTECKPSYLDALLIRCKIKEAKDNESIFMDYIIKTIFILDLKMYMSDLWF